MRERKHIRLRNYDYSQSGYYFITVCTQHRKECFGQVRNEEMELNIFGEIARGLWTENFTTF